MRTRAELHLHTDFSMLDGLGKIPLYVEQAKRKGVIHLGITDHGTLAGVYEHYRECLTHEIEPVLGMEAYFAPSAEEARQFKDAERFHVTLLAIGEQGYRILKEVNDEAHRNFYYKPLVDRHLMEGLGDASKHLYVLSGCAGSILSQRALEGGLAATREELAWWTRVFPNFAIELQFHGTSVDAKLTKKLLKLSQLANLPIVVTNDCHYVNQKDAHTHDALLAIQTGANIDDPERFRFDGSGYHLRSRAELRRAFGEHLSESDWRAAANNSLAIARTCRIRIPAWDNRTWHIPKFPGVDDAFREIVKLTKRGLRDKGLSDNDIYVLRTRSELRKIKQTGIADFLLIRREIVRWAKQQGIRVGPGRGSVAGCLVAYLIGIHDVDSIKGNLKFERFLNPERPKMPDIDTDYQPSRRDEVFQHEIDMFGSENIMRVAAYQTMKVAGAFRKLASTHGISWSEINRLSKDLNFDEDDDTEDWSVLPAEIRETYPDLHKQIVEMLGTKSAISKHAGGILIFSPDDPVQELIPHQWVTAKEGKSGYMAGAFDLKSTEKIGLMKNDELGLRTLDTIEHCVQLLKQRGQDVEPNDWVPDDEPGDSDVYAMLAQGRTAGVFQMEGNTNARGIVEIRCNCFEDIVACTALYRAGPLGVGADKRYLKNKRSRKVRVAHEILRPILSDSWGEMIYQEQMMDICRNVAGFSWADTDDVKETVRFKDPVKMATFKDRFIKGCMEISDLDLDTSEQIWKMIESQASYLYNRSHAYSYSVTSYQTARLKLLHPLEYMASYLATVKPLNDSAKARRAKIMAEAYELGFQILPPDINESDVHMTCEEGALRFGFSDIKGIGESTADKIIEARSEGFDTVQDVTSSLGKRALDALAGCGALESVGGPRRVMRRCEEYVDWSFVDRMAKWRPRLRDQCKFPHRDGAYCAVVGEVVKNEKRATKANKPYRSVVLKWSPAEHFTFSLWSETSGVWDRLTVGTIAAIEGKYSREFNNISCGDIENINVLREHHA